MVNWKNIHQDFTPELQKRWEDGGFDYGDCKEWIDVGLRPEDADFAYYLWEENYTAEEVGSQFETNNLWELREEYAKRYGLCRECKKPNTGDKWCQSCNSKHFQDEFKNWTSDNDEINAFIQKYQLTATSREEVLEWIPYEQFTNVKEITRGGFGKVYKAEWTDGYINSWDIGYNEWERKMFTTRVVLKCLNNLQDLKTDFLQEIANHQLFNSESIGIVPCYGISQDPETKDCLMVMQYIPGGNLRQYLQNNYKKIDLKDKIRQLCYIVNGLKKIHDKGIIHKDFHSGNILGAYFITDLGLSRSADEENEEGKVYGVLPYVAPEVLRESSYIQASDIYSFGMIAYEILTGLPPYRSIDHDLDLALKICQGLRPKFNIKIPPLLEGLINQCWDAEPSNRPTTTDLKKVLDDWRKETSWNKNTEFYRQYKESEEFNQKLSPEVRFPNYDLPLDDEAYHNKPLPTKEITKQLGGSRDLELDINKLDELNIQEEQDENSIQAQIEVPSE